MRTLRLSSWAIARWAVAACVMASCNYDRPGFDCGEQVQPGSQIVRLCDRPREVCVCATRKCAVLDTSCSQSGLRYVEPPFGLVTEQGQMSCVAAEDSRWLIVDTQPELSCERLLPPLLSLPVPDAGATDADIDADIGADIDASTDAMDSAGL